MEHRQYVMEYIREIDELLDFEYGSPDHNNKEDPLDELVFILLSRRTRGVGYETVYDRLKKKFPDWEDAAKAPPQEILRIIESAGLGPKRVKEIKDNLHVIHESFGEYSLDRLRKWHNGKVFEFLTSLEGIGPKSAYCIMMYSLKREVFPVDTHVNRICQRLGIIEMGLDHKKGQALLAETFPKPLRYSLHVNMVAHGREVCRSTNPRCSDCIISGFCKWIRLKSKADGRHKFADLFAGAGGMSLGFEKAGYNLQVAIDSDPRACATFLHNRTYLDAETVINKNIADINPRKYAGKGIKVIVAGPPCQEFSRVRKNGLGETGRNELYKEVLRFVRAIKPVFVVIENVPGMASHLNKEYVKKVEDGLRKLGYAVHSEMINAKHYGIPQNRLRLFFIARRVYRDSWEVAERAVNRVWERIHLEKQDAMVSFRQGISGLPRLSPGEGADLLRNGRRGKPSDYARKMAFNGGIIFNHIARKHNPRDLEAYATMEEGENALDLHRKRPDLMPYSTKNFPTKFFKIRSGNPSPTIVAHLRRDANSFIHPRDNRGITPREAARLQSFPDNYRFLGSFGLQFEQIGNAVPPLLAEVIGNAIMEELDASKRGKNNG
ncbi:MAG: DNA (cytosine-5-)-methyltransferase [Deltaproteobacteria bacterium]|nr:DNA (cytosine-5-)-methyltransferase [Deltaproteobacteria bacterium]